MGWVVDLVMFLVFGVLLLGGAYFDAVGVVIVLIGGV